MPIRTTEDPAKLESVETASEKYLIFYSSRNEQGKLWCPVRILSSIPSDLLCLPNTYDTAIE